MQFISSGSLRALLVLCVFIPLLLAATGIFSTTFDTTLQSQMVMGMPLFLWLWIGVSMIICTLIIWVGMRLTFKTTDDSLDDVSTLPTLPSQGVSHE